MNKYVNVFLNILYPRHCPVCHSILKDQKTLICPECEKGFCRIGEDYCLKCGKPVKDQEEYCGECSALCRSFDQGKSVFIYNGKLRQSLVRYKYYGCREYGDYYADAVCRYTGKDIRRWQPDVIVPVPLTNRKQRMRGFNQSAYLADRVGEQLQIPVAHGLVKKVRSTKSQKKLNAAQRRQNLADAFRAEENIRGLTVLVIDDVYTTGSTVDAMARCLKEAGAEHVYFITLCTGQQ